MILSPNVVKESLHFDRLSYHASRASGTILREQQGGIVTKKVIVEIIQTRERIGKTFLRRDVKDECGNGP